MIEYWKNGYQHFMKFEDEGFTAVGDSLEEAYEMMFDFLEGPTSSKIYLKGEIEKLLAEAIGSLNGRL